MATFLNSTRSFYHIEIRGICGALNDEALELFKKIGQNVETLFNETCHYGSIWDCFPRLQSVQIPNLNVLFYNKAPRRFHLHDLLPIKVAPGVTVNVLGNGQRIGLSREKYQLLKDMNLKALTFNTLFVEREADKRHPFPICPISDELMRFAGTFKCFGERFLIKPVNLLEIPELRLEHVVGFYRHIFRIENWNLMFNEPWNLTHLTSLDFKSAKRCFIPHSMPALMNLKKISLDFYLSSELCSQCLASLRANCGGIEEAHFEGKCLNIQSFIDILPPSLRRLQLDFGTNPIHDLNLDFPMLESLVLSYLPDCQSWTPMPSLKKLELKEAYHGNEAVFSQNLKTLILKCPNAHQVNIEDYTSISLLQNIQNGWPFLRKLNTAFKEKEDGEIVMEEFNGGLKYLRHFSPIRARDDQKRMPNERFSRVLEMHPNLRRFFGWSYAWVVCNDECQNCMSLINVFKLVINHSCFQPVSIFTTPF